MVITVWYLPNLHTTRKKLEKFHTLKGWMFSSNVTVVSLSLVVFSRGLEKFFVFIYLFGSSALSPI
jgi:hypothetical protein